MLAATLPLFLLIAIGFVAVRFGVYPKDMLPAIGRAILYFCIPAVILSNLVGSGSGVLFHGPYILAYSLASLATLGIVVVLYKWIYGRLGAEGPVYGIGASVANSMFVGFPVVNQVLPDVAVQLLVMAVLIENLIVTPLGLAVAESRAAHQNAFSKLKILRETFQRLSTNPLIVAVVIGGLISTFNMQLPRIILDALDMLASGAAGMALIYIGGSLVGHSVRGDLGTIGLVSLGKLVVHPLLVLGAFAIVPGNGPVLTLGAVVMAAAPMMTIFPVLGARFGLGQTCASTLAFTTALAFVSLNLWLWVLF